MKRFTSSGSGFEEVPRRARPGGTDFLFRSRVPVAGAFLAALVATPLHGAVRPPQETKILSSTRLKLDGTPRFPAGAPVDGAPALLIEGDDITVELKGLLRGVPPGTAPDQHAGTGILVTGQRVTLRGARVAGFKVAIEARGADGLVLEDCDVSDNFRQHLRSGPEKEAVEDWLSPHDNDEGQWIRNYGAGIHVQRSRAVTVRRCRARDVQNGLVLDRVDGSRVYDNDFSFLSGWGVAMWRSSDNVIAHNALDFCVRGYVHGVYNRGQDSAGLLVFEQCSRNLIAENSITHGGDGVFGFAGQEALGGRDPMPEGFDVVGAGCNANRFVGNDLSFAAAHGLEMTFSFDNVITGNRFEGNAICGIWGGYSRRTVVEDNRFERNGDAGYGLERGGVNIEHGQGNRIERNAFLENTCGVHLWWDADAHLAEVPWVVANGFESKDERVVANTFTRDAIGIQLRGPTNVALLGNTFDEVDEELKASEEAVTTPAGLTRPVEGAAGSALPELPGETRPVGARARWRSREHIRVGEWGPIEPDA
jgi:parallel beta-helix repeat protein